MKLQQIKVLRTIKRGLRQIQYIYIDEYWWGALIHNQAWNYLQSRKEFYVNAWCPSQSAYVTVIFRVNYPKRELGICYYNNYKLYKIK